MLDYPLHFLGRNSTVSWGDSSASLAVVMVALAVLLFTCCAAAALFLVACCGSRRRDAVAETGDSRWLPGIGLIDYVPVSDRSSVRVSLLFSESSQGSELQEDLNTPSPEALIPVHLTSPTPVHLTSPTPAATTPSAFVNSCGNRSQLPAQKASSVTISAAVKTYPLRQSSRQRPRSLPASPTKSLFSFAMLSQETTYPVLVSFNCDQVSRPTQTQWSTASLSRSASLSLPSIISLAVTRAPLTPTVARTEAAPSSPPLNATAATLSIVTWPPFPPSPAPVSLAAARETVHACSNLAACTLSSLKGENMESPRVLVKT
nr:rho family-interacting cell polarization regulator 1-like [Procambarus clarkii]